VAAKATEVDEYLGSLPEKHRGVLTLPLDVIGESVGRIPVDEYIRRYESVKRK